MRWVEGESQLGRRDPADLRVCPFGAREILLSRSTREGRTIVEKDQSCEPRIQLLLPGGTGEFLHGATCKPYCQECCCFR